MRNVSSAARPARPIAGRTVGDLLDGRATALCLLDCIDDASIGRFLADALNLFTSMAAVWFKVPANTELLGSFSCGGGSQ